LKGTRRTTTAIATKPVAVTVRGGPSGGIVVVGPQVGLKLVPTLREGRGTPGRLLLRKRRCGVLGSFVRA
jgi:hypothetical protein